MGLYRLVLAIVVAVSHTYGALLGYNPGAVAVISFLMLSGYVMAILIDRHYLAFDRVPAFYLDRAARLFPQFLFYLTASFALVSHMQNAWCPGSPDNIPLGQVAQTYLMLPLGFFFYLGITCQLMPQAWSLGLELTFYLIATFILLYVNKPAAWALYVGSLFVSVAACEGYLNPDVWGYRLLPGTLFIFLTGMALAKPKRFGMLLPLATLGFGISMFVTVNLRPSIYAAPFNKELYLGVIIGVVAIYLLRRKRFSPLDEFFGNLSYGVFLSHLVVSWFLWHHFGQVSDTLRGTLIVIVASLIIGTISYFLVEQPALAVRHVLRRSSEAKIAEASPAST